MKAVSIEESKRFSARIPKPRQFAANYTDQRIALKDDESKILENVNLERDYLEGREGFCLKGHTTTETAGAPTSAERIPLQDIDDDVIASIEIDGKIFAATKYGRIYYTSSTQNVKANWQTLNWSLRDQTWPISLDLGNGARFQSTDMDLLYLWANPISLAIDLNTLVCRVAGMPKISCALARADYTENWPSVGASPQYDPNINVIHGNIFDTESVSKYYRVYGIELIEAAKDASGNFILDTTEYTTTEEGADPKKVRGFPIRLRSSGIQRYAQKEVVLSSTAYSNVGSIDFKIDNNLGLAYDGNMKRDLMRTSHGTAIHPIIDFSSLGMTYANLLAGAPFPIEWANFHGWTHIILWRSKLLKDHTETQDFDTDPTKYAADGIEDEMYMVASWDFDTLMESTDRYYTHVSLPLIGGKQPIWLIPGIPSGGTYTTIETAEAEIWNSKVYTSPVPDNLLFANFEEMDLEPIKGNSKTILAGSRIWTPTNIGNRDSILQYGFGLVEFLGVYREQTEPQKFIECRQGQNGSISNLAYYDGELYVFKERETGVIPNADTNQKYETLQNWIGIPEGYPAIEIPGLGVAAITSDRFRFGIFSGRSWQYDFGGRNISRNLGSLEDPNLSAGYADGCLYLVSVIDTGSTLKIHRISIEHGSGWHSWTLKAGNDLRKGQAIFINLSPTLTPCIIWQDCPPILLKPKNATSTKRQIQAQVILGNDNLFAHDQNPETGAFIPVQCKFDTSFFNSSEGRDLLEFRYLSIVAGMAGPAQVDCFVNGVPWGGLLDPRIQGGLNFPYGADYSREFSFYPGKDAQDLKAVGQNMHFEITTLSPFHLRGLDLFCFVTTDPQIEDYDPSSVIAAGAGSTPPQALARPQDMMLWATRPDHTKQQATGAEPIRLFRPFIQAGSPNRLRGEL